MTLPNMPPLPLAEHLPAELKQADQWITWRYGEREGKTTKVPTNPRTGSPVDVSDRTAWVSFEDACTAAETHQHGIGFSLADGFCGIDLDECVDDKGRPNSAAWTLIKQFDSYTERTPSGNGFHIIVRAKLPGAGGKVSAKLPEPFQLIKAIEMYDSKRFFTVTGNAAKHPFVSSSVEDRQTQAETLYNQIFQRAIPRFQTHGAPVELSDEDIREKIQQSQQGKKFEKLWSGETSGHKGDRSAADLALCSILAFWLACDAKRMDHWFRQSGLFRGKWDEQRGDQTYGQMTIAKAIAETTETYQPHGKAPSVNGLVPKIERFVKQDNYFARDTGGLLYVYQRGAYRPTGEWLIKGEVKRYCADTNSTWSPELASRLTEFITVDAPELWERPPMDTINVENGLLDTRTHELRPHSPEFLSPVQLAPRFDAAARCPAIEKFCSEVLPDDTQSIAFQIAAWLMAPETSLQKAVLLIGEGANGKSIFLTLIEDFLGRDNVSSVSLHKIEADRFAASRLVGKLANICADLPTAALASTSTFKAITGGDLIGAERKFSAGFDFRPYSRLVFSANTPPRSDDATPGFFRRWLVVPFERRTFTEGDPATIPSAILRARLGAPDQLSGLLNRALEALPQIQSGRFNESDSMRAAWQEFRSTTDPLAVWLDSNTVENPDASIPKRRMRELYTSECRDAGRPMLAETVFTSRLRQLRPRVTTGQRRINRKQEWCFLGIGLRADEPTSGGLWSNHESQTAETLAF